MALNGYYSQLAHFALDVKHAISTRWWADQNRGHNHFLIKFELVLISYSFSKFKRLLCLLHGHPRTPASQIKTNYDVDYWTQNDYHIFINMQSNLFQTHPFWCAFLDPHQTPYHSNIEVSDRLYWERNKQGTSTIFVPHICLTFLEFYITRDLNFANWSLGMTSLPKHYQVM